MLPNIHGPGWLKHKEPWPYVSAKKSWFSAVSESAMSQIAGWIIVYILAHTREDKTKNADALCD